MFTFCLYTLSVPPSVHYEFRWQTTGIPRLQTCSVKSVKKSITLFSWFFVCSFDFLFFWFIISWLSGGMQHSSLCFNTWKMSTKNLTCSKIIFAPTFPFLRRLFKKGWRSHDRSYASFNAFSTWVTLLLWPGYYKWWHCIFMTTVSFIFKEFIVWNFKLIFLIRALLLCI